MFRQIEKPESHPYDASVPIEAEEISARVAKLFGRFSYNEQNKEYILTENYQKNCYTRC